MIKLLLLAGAILFFILGVIGLVLPIIPQVPFFILSALLLSAASENYKKRLVSSNLYQKYLKKYVDKNDKLKRFMDS